MIYIKRKGDFKMSVNFSLEGKVALVTGASYVIGFANARRFGRSCAAIPCNDS